MDIIVSDHENQENARGLSRAWIWIKGLIQKMVYVPVCVVRDAKKLGSEDPRRIVHSLKVGFAITSVSLLYYFDFLYEGFGVSAMWAVITVVILFQFFVGATLGKGVNRGLATFLGGALGLGAYHLSSVASHKAQCVVLGLSVFLIVTVVTFFQFFPKLKARYDYGLLIFNLTFCLISVSGDREEEVIKMAHRRLSTILIGGSASVLICTLIFPNWAGEDLHKMISINIEKLAIFLEGFGNEYFHMSTRTKDGQTLSLNGYKAVLNSKGIEDSLVNFAKWEPGHGKFRYRHPWDQYLKIGSLTRECACRIDALNAYLISENQTPFEIREKIQESCTKLSLECSFALRELSLGIKTMTCSLSADSHIINAQAASIKLKAHLETGIWTDADVLDIIPAATVASLLIKIVSCTIKIADSAQELASLAKFKTPITPLSPIQKIYPGHVVCRPTSLTKSCCLKWKIYFNSYS